MLYRFANFPYFFILLALGMLAYSWRTVWAMGTWISIVLVDWGRNRRSIRS